TAGNTASAQRSTHRVLSPCKLIVRSMENSMPQLTRAQITGLELENRCALFPCILSQWIQNIRHGYLALSNRRRPDEVPATTAKEWRFFLNHCETVQSGINYLKMNDLPGVASHSHTLCCRQKPVIYLTKFENQGMIGLWRTTNRLVPQRLS